MGGVAASKQNMYPRNTVTHLKRLLGETFSSPDLQADLKRFPFTVLEGQRGGCLVQVSYSDQTTTFSPEQLVAMYLVYLKQMVTKETNVGVTDCVVSVPAYFTEGTTCNAGCYSDSWSQLPAADGRYGRHCSLLRDIQKRLARRKSSLRSLRGDGPHRPAGKAPASSFT